MVGVPKEVVGGERRVAAVPETVAKLKAAGFAVQVEAGAGTGAQVSDQAYEQAGATVVGGAGSVLSSSDVVLKVQPPTAVEAARLKEGAILVSFLQPAANAAIVEQLAKQGVTAFSLELVPRISRAQSMDALSSQASLAGYKAVLMAAVRLGKYFPMLMSAAGTIPPARVLVLGAGVAGLQAIATARRLGAVVEAYDVRPAVKDEVQSLGAKFLELKLESQEGAGGYAKELSADQHQRELEFLARSVKDADVVISTAAIPGKRAPILVTRAAEVVETGGVFIDGTLNVPSTIPVHASQLYSRNVANLLLSVTREGEVNLDFDDEVIKGSVVTHAGEIVNERAREMVEAASLGVPA